MRCGSRASLRAGVEHELSPQPHGDFQHLSACLAQCRECTSQKPNLHPHIPPPTSAMRQPQGRASCRGDGKGAQVGAREMEKHSWAAAPYWIR